jgi:hypothetical protein
VEEWPWIIGWIVAPQASFDIDAPADLAYLCSYKKVRVSQRQLFRRTLEPFISKASQIELEGKVASPGGA